MSHITPGESTIGVIGIGIRTTRIGCEFYLLWQGKLNVCWVTVAITEGIQSQLLKKSHMGSPRMDFDIHLTNSGCLLVPPGGPKVHRQGYHPPL